MCIINRPIMIIIKKSTIKGPFFNIYGWKLLNNIRYADDTVIFADSIEGLQQLMDKVNEVSERYGLKMNINKTKFMVVRKEKKENCQLII